MRKNSFLEKVYRGLIYILPVVLFFSYHPVIHFGASESMNFEISLPLIWLVIFDFWAFIIMVRKKKLLKGLRGKWVWLLFPGFLTISVLWSLNSVRGILTVGILWFLYFAIYAMFDLKDEFEKTGFKEKFWKVFFWSAVGICGFCILQCVLDLAGVSRVYSLMCEGCTYQSFGFPHPNGFAIEPQFMGNLLLAPAIIAGAILVKDKSHHIFRGRGSSLPSSRGSDPSALGRNLRKPLKILVAFIFITTLFLTFSRGAIYAFLVGLMFMSGFWLVREKQGRIKQIVKLWGLVVVAFLFALNAQGIMAAVSPTNDTYLSGVSKALNHLSLGVIDVREGEKVLEEKQGNEQELPVENPVENFSTFDGYVEESTNTRIELNEMALKVWAKDFKTVMLGVGLGGAGQALYENGLTDSPKEIIQNQYVSLLLETGLIGIGLMIFTLILIVRLVVKKSASGIILSLMVAYGVSLLFFAGLPNALQIYLLPALVMLLI